MATTIERTRINELLASPESVWPEVDMIEVTPDSAAALPADSQDRDHEIREILSQYLRLDPSLIEGAKVTTLPSGAMLLRVARAGELMSALTQRADERGTNTVEVVHHALAQHYGG